MIFSKLTPATLLFTLALTATGRPNLKLSDIVRRSDGGKGSSLWDDVQHYHDHHESFDTDHYSDHEEHEYYDNSDGEHSGYYPFYDQDDDESYWDHDYDEYYWGSDDEYWNPSNEEKWSSHEDDPWEWHHEHNYQDNESWDEEPAEQYLELGQNHHDDWEDSYDDHYHDDSWDGEYIESYRHQSWDDHDWEDSHDDYSHDLDEHDYHIHDWDEYDEQSWPDSNQQNDWDNSWDNDWEQYNNDWEDKHYTDDWDNDWDDNVWEARGHSSLDWGNDWDANHLDWDWSGGYTYDYQPGSYGYGAMTVFAGAGTVYEQDGLAGSCGEVYDDDAFICALGNAWMNYEYKSDECGRKIRVTNLGSHYPVGGEGRSIIVTVKDTCESCDEDHIDLSIGAWNALTDYTAPGLLNIEWAFI